MKQIRFLALKEGWKRFNTSWRPQKIFFHKFTFFPHPNMAILSLTISTTHIQRETSTTICQRTKLTHV